MAEHQHIVDVDPDMRGIARLFLEKFGTHKRDLRVMLNMDGDKEGIRQLEAMFQTLLEIMTEPQVDCVPLHEGVRLLGRIMQDEKEDAVEFREKAVKRNAVRRYSEKKHKPTHEFNDKDWKRISRYREDQKEIYEDCKDQAELCKDMQHDLIHMLNLMGVPPRRMPPDNPSYASL